MADLYPLRVEVNEDNILKITSTFKEAYKSIIAEIENATDFGVKNRRSILSQTEKILKELGVDVDKFLKEELPEYYKLGADDAIKQLKKIGADTPVVHGFSTVHKEAIIALIDDASRAFGDSLTGVNRSARLLLNKTTKQMITQKIAEGTIGGKALKDSTKIVKSVLKDQGLAALIDKGGKRWELDTYAEMLLRTKAVEARNRGLVNRTAENGYDLVQVSDHMGECDLCRPWEGKILSLTGATKGYPTLQQAESSGLFHPNCKHAINALHPELASMTKAYYPEEKTKVISEAEVKKAVKNLSS